MSGRLVEISQTRQRPGEPRRRWFYSHEQDLYVWYGADGNISAFQLCYDKERSERVLYWRADRGYAHLRVDSVRRHATPVLVADGRFDRDRVLTRFSVLAEELPEDVAEWVCRRLRAYAPPRTEPPWWKEWF